MEQACLSALSAQKRLLSLGHLLTSLHHLGLMLEAISLIRKRLDLKLLWAKHASTRARLHDSLTSRTANGSSLRGSSLSLILFLPIDSRPHAIAGQLPQSHLLFCTCNF